MPRMLRELDGRAGSGFLGHIMALGVTVQCWRSFEHLEAYARNGDVGIWHETYQVRAGQYETVYSGMPPFGLGRVGTLVPASGARDTAKGRFSARTESA